MNLDKIGVVSLPQFSNQVASEKKVKSEFSSLLSGALQDVNELQRAADELSEQYALGNVEDVHQVMTAIQEAQLAMQLTVQIRNKLTESYQEIMRMQI